MKIECPHCSQHYEIEDKDMFSRFQCVKCNSVFQLKDLNGFGVRIYGINDYDEYKNISDIVERLGGKIKSRVTKDGCQLVIRGGDFDPMFDTASKYGIPVISKQDFIDSLSGIWGDKKQSNIMDIFLESAEVDYDFQQQRTKERILYKDRVTIQLPPLDRINPDHCFLGKGLCFTGFSDADKKKIAQFSENAGFKLKNSVSGRVNFLVCGPNAGPSKIAKCKELGIPVIDFEEFVTLIAPNNQNVE